MVVNGKDYDLEPLTISNLLSNFKLDKDKVVVELNFHIISKENFEDIVVNKADKVEIVAFVGGG